MITLTITGESGRELQEQMRSMLDLPAPTVQTVTGNADVVTADAPAAAEAPKRVRRTKEQIAADEAAAAKAAANTVIAAAAAKQDTPNEQTQPAPTQTATAPGTAAPATTASPSPSDVPDMTAIREYCNKLAKENPQGRAILSSALAQVSSSNLTGLEGHPEKIAQFWALVKA